jgi:Tol biopolymer transport system component
MNDSAQRVLVNWLLDGPERGPEGGLERALAATRRTSQRPGWIIPERWIPMQLTMSRAIIPRPLVLLFAVALLAVALTAVALFAGAFRPSPAPPFGLAANGQIAFDSNGAIVLANADGSSPRPLSIGMGRSYTPTFSPNGERLAFLSREADRMPFHLWVANADGSAARNLTPDLPIVAELWESPSWSPDSSRLTFSSSVDGVHQVHVVNADGTGVEAITDRTTSRTSPAWSPSGDWILFRKDAANGEPGPSLAIVRPDGGEERKLVSLDFQSNAGFSGSQWSPQGDRIAYWAGPDAMHDVFVVDLAGTIIPVSSEPESEYGVSWAPAGDRVVFQADGSGFVVASADGTDRDVLGSVLDCGATFSPDGKSLLGYAPGTDCQQLLIVPIDAPADARPLAGAQGVSGTASWQRRAP